MKYWISITIYLWKNIWSRWFESPLSAISKILLTFLLSLLALTLVGIMRQTEEILEERLSASDVLTAKISVFAEPGKDESRVEKSLFKEAMLKRLLASDEIDFIRRPFTSAKDADKKNISIAVSFGTPTFWKKEWGEFQQPKVYLLSEPGTLPVTEATLDDFPLEFEYLPLPEGVSRNSSDKHMILLPYPSGELLLKYGFSEHLLFTAESIGDLRNSLAKAEAYLSAERMRYSVTSGLGILAELETFSQIQKYIRVGLVFLMITIIAIVLGNQALLEFREQQYHYALLRSFGVPYFLILFNDLIEKALLAILGFTGAFYFIPTLVKYATQYTESIGTFRLILVKQDLYFIGGGVLAGVLLSWLFLAVTSKKQIGLVLS